MHRKETTTLYYLIMKPKQKQFDLSLIKARFTFVVVLILCPENCCSA